MEKPKEYEVINAGHARFNGRDYYGPGSSDRAELDYLRAYKAWADNAIAAVIELVRTTK